MGLQDKVEVYFDGGVRRGTDVFKALALGARAVFIGRPILWGLGTAGQRGVEKVLEILNRELKQAMLACDCHTLDDIRQKGVIFKEEDLLFSKFNYFKEKQL